MINILNLNLFKSKVFLSILLVLLFSATFSTSTYSEPLDPSTTASFCGDGNCDIADGEDSLICPEDCSEGSSYCGDGNCDPDEDCNSCDIDCGICPSACGDGNCDPDEDCNSCDIDCGICPPACGDGNCDPGEDSDTCSIDCPVQGLCGNGVCNLPDEDCTTCAIDCGACPPICGNGTIEPPEVCDDGNVIDGDGCSAACDLEEGISNSPYMEIITPEHVLVESTRVRNENGEVSTFISVWPHNGEPYIEAEGIPYRTGSSCDCLIDFFESYTIDPTILVHNQNLGARIPEGTPNENLLDEFPTIEIACPLEESDSCQIEQSLYESQHSGFMNGFSMDFQYTDATVQYLTDEERRLSNLPYPSNFQAFASSRQLEYSWSGQARHVVLYSPLPLIIIPGLEDDISVEEFSPLEALRGNNRHWGRLGYFTRELFRRMYYGTEVKGTNIFLDAYSEILNNNPLQLIRSVPVTTQQRAVNGMDWPLEFGVDNFAFRYLVIIKNNENRTGRSAKLVKFVMDSLFEIPDDNVIELVEPANNAVVRQETFVALQNKIEEDLNEYLSLKDTPNRPAPLQIPRVEVLFYIHEHGYLNTRETPDGETIPMLELHFLGEFVNDEFVPAMDGAYRDRDKVLEYAFKEGSLSGALDKSNLGDVYFSSLINDDPFTYNIVNRRPGEPASITKPKIVDTFILVGNQCYSGAWIE